MKVFIVQNGQTLIIAGAFAQETAAKAYSCYREDLYPIKEIEVVGIEATILEAIAKFILFDCTCHMCGTSKCNAQRLVDRMKKQFEGNDG